MPRVRTALYLDFDNVFSGLIKLDPRLAKRFAEDPGSWVERLASRQSNEGNRRWLILRCYVNPGGSVPDPDGGSRLHFAKYRLPFTDAGFEVVDCPRLTHTKNGADIRMALDAVEALRGEVRYDEFVIASGDSDMTPLLLRLRAADRRTTVVSPSDSAVVLGAIADRLIGGEAMLELLEEELVPDEPDPLPEVAGQSHELLSRFAGLVHERYDAADQPVNLAALGQQVRAEIGPASTTDGWFGHGTLTKALQALDLPDVRMSGHFLWDGSRHEAPDEPVNGAPADVVPDVVARVTAELRLPRLGSEVWRPIYETLAAFVAAYEFHLTEATRWTRDRLVENGIGANRKAAAVVALGASYAGCPLYRQPAPTADEIGTAFVSNVASRAEAADIELTPQDVDALRSWFGAGQN